MSCLLAKIRRDAPASLCQRHCEPAAAEEPTKHSHLPTEDCAILLCNLPCACDLPSQLPRRWHLFARNNCASTAAVCVDLPHPLRSTLSGWRYAKDKSYSHTFNVYLAERQQRALFVSIDDLTNLPCMNVLMLKPSVGLTSLMSSPFNFLSIVVLPALSSPLMRLGWSVNKSQVAHRNKIRISFSFWRFFLIIVSRPMLYLLVRVLWRY